jgi:plastocyanin
MVPVRRRVTFSRARTPIAQHNTHPRIARLAIWKRLCFSKNQKPKVMKIKILWLAALMLGLLVACSDDDDNDLQPANEVWMSDTSFLPATLTVSAGTTVRWVNTSSIDHTVTSNDGLFDEFLEPDGVFTFVFNTPGTYAYVCVLHPGMDGTIIVE